MIRADISSKEMPGRLTFDSTTPGVCFMAEGLRLIYGIELLQAAVLVQRLLPHAC
jgi:hypothetical protein